MKKQLIVEYDTDFPWKVDIPLVLDFLNGDKETMLITYGDHWECKKRRTAIKSRLGQLGYSFKTSIKDNVLYIAKE